MGNMMEVHELRQKMLKETISIIQESVPRLKGEIGWIRNQVCNSSSQYTEYLYQIRHKELTIGFKMGRLEELVRQLKVQDILYGRNS